LPEGSLPREGAHRGERTAFGNTEDVLESRTVYTKQTQIAELARKLPGRRLVSLNHPLAIVMVLEPIYEQEFLPCSYGFRPGRSPHQALQSLWRQIMATGGCWLIDADISKFFDTLDKAILRDFLNQRVGDAMLSEAFILKNRMREIRSYGSVGGLGREAQVYPERPACAGRRRRFG